MIPIGPTKPEELKRRIAMVEAAYEEIRPQLAGLPWEAQDAVLANMLARWLAGSHPDLRDKRMIDTLALAKYLSVRYEELYDPAKGYQ